MAIVELNAPQIDRKFANQLVEFVQNLRKQPLKKPPSVTESIDWALSMHLFGGELTPEAVRATLTALLKYTKDRELVADKLPYLLKP